jgi:hypothetical protein
MIVVGENAERFHRLAQLGFGLPYRNQKEQRMQREIEISGIRCFRSRTPFTLSGLVAMVIWAVCLISSATNVPAAETPDDIARPQTRPTIQVLAWGGPPATIDRLREMAEAGFTISFNGFADLNAAVAGLDAARVAGVRLLVSCPQLKSDPAAAAEKLRSHPALAGYFLKDEPAASSFAELARWLRQLRAADGEHDAYINLFPNYATAQQLGVTTYQEYLDEFVKTVPVSFLSFDHYPVVQRPGGTAVLRPLWYENLGQASAAARRARVPLWAFALSTRHFNYPTATLAHLRVQAFSDLAYGAQTIQYFIYWQGDSNTSLFKDAPLEDGKRTAVYDRVKQVNQEVRGLAAVFAGSQVIALGHTGRPIPQGSDRYEPRPPVSAIKTDGPPGSGALVSLLSNGDRRFLVLVNRDINAALVVSMTLDDSPQAAGIELVEKDGRVRALVDKVFQTELAPGDIAVFAWKESKAATSVLPKPGGPESRRSDRSTGYKSAWLPAIRSA